MDTKMTKHQFVDSFPWPPGWEWFDLTGLFKMSNLVRAKLELSIGDGTPTYGTYVGFQLTIMNVHTGTIDKKLFVFNDYMPVRADNRTDYPMDFKVVSHCGWDWHIARPSSSSVGNFVAAITSYISGMM